MYNNSNIGLNLIDSPYTYCANNFIYHNGGDGIQHIGSSEGTILYNNTIFGNEFSGIFLFESELVTVSHNTIFQNTQSGIEIEFMGNNVISYNTLHDNNGCGIVFQGGSQGCIFSNNYVYNNSYCGISLQGWGQISHNIVRDNGGKGLQIEAYSESVMIINNTIQNQDYGIFLQGGVNCTLTENQIFNCGVCGIWLSGSYSSQILDNTVQNNFQGILLDSGSSFTTIQENLISYQGDFGISLDSHSTNNTVLNNEICYNNVGLSIGSAYNTIEHNLVYNNSEQGFYVYVSDNSLSGNLVFNNSMGIHLSSCHRGIIRDNLVYNNSLSVGVFESENCQILGNTIAGNNGTGILFDSSYCFVVNNSLIQNRFYGIETRGTGHFIYHNNFVFNHNGGIQANNLYFTDNQWDNGAEGNYWDDWVTPDNYSDGIVDYPYVLEGEIAIYDYYPLVIPRPIQWRGFITLEPAPGTVLLPSSPINVTIIHPFQPNIYFSWDNLSFLPLSPSNTLLAPADDGQHELYFKITNFFGYNTTKTFFFSIDGSSPSIFLLSPTNGSLITIGGSILINVTDLSLQTVYYQWSSLSFFKLLPPYKLLIPNITGWQQLTITASDFVGLYTTKTYLFFLNDAPVIEVIYPLDLSIVPSGINCALHFIDFYGRIDWIWYSWNNKSFDFVEKSSYHNQTETTLHMARIPYNEGWQTLTVYVNDTFGVVSKKNIFIYVDSTPPSISSPDDIVITQGEDTQINWTIYDLNPMNFSIFWNNILVNSGEWTSGDSIYYLLKGLSVGNYNFTILVIDVVGNRMIDEVHVTVIPSTTTSIHPLTTTIIITTSQPLTTTFTTTITYPLTTTYTTPATVKSTTTSPSSLSSSPPVLSPGFTLICVLSMVVCILVFKKSFKAKKWKEDS